MSEQLALFIPIIFSFFGLCNVMVRKIVLILFGWGGKVQANFPLKFLSCKETTQIDTW